MPFRRSMLTAAFAGAIAASGCHQPKVMTQADHVYYNRISGELRDQPADPSLHALSTVEPPTVEDFGKREEYPLALEECKRLALANNKQIAFLGFATGQRGTRIDQQLAQFDAAYGFGGQWGRSERQISNQAQAAGGAADAQTVNSFGQQAGGFGQNTNGGGPTDGDQPLPALNLFDLRKRNATGGTTSIGYSLDYTRQRPAGFTLINPAWNNTLALTMTQPLLQGGGVEFNRARILIARANFDQSIREFDGRVRELLRDVELAYWQLHASYRQKFARERQLEILMLAFRNETEREGAGARAPRDVARIREDLERTRGDLLRALNEILDSERQLRRLCGLPPADNKRIVLKDEPSRAHYALNYAAAVHETMELRPELSAQRLAIRAAELELQRQKNGLLPDLTVGGSYQLTGIDNQYDQSLNRLFSNRYTGWTMFFRLTRPIGERAAAHADVRNATLALSGEQYRLRALEDQLVSELQQAKQEIAFRYLELEPRGAQRRALEKQLESDYAMLEIGRIDIDQMVQSVTRLADAELQENAALVAYNQALARWEFAKGTILRNDNVQLAEEVCSAVCPDIRERVRRQLACAWTLPIHPGNCPHPDTDQCPDRSLPLYRTQLPDGGVVSPPAAVETLPTPPKPEAKPKADDRKPDAKKPDDRKPENSADRPSNLLPMPRSLEIPAIRAEPLPPPKPARTTTDMVPIPDAAGTVINTGWAPAR